MFISRPDTLVSKYVWMIGSLSLWSSIISHRDYYLLTGQINICHPNVDLVHQMCISLFYFFIDDRSQTR